MSLRLYKSLSLGLTISLTCAPLSIAQTVYTWTDENGNLHFSDMPQHKQAKAIELPDFDYLEQKNSEQPTEEEQYLLEAETTSADNSHISQLDQNLPQSLSLSILSPQHDQALRSNSGKITIQAELNRKLLIGEQLQLVMNGKNYGAPQFKPQWLLKNIDRGTHSFVIQAFRDGKLIASSHPITVHLQRATVKKAASTS